MSALFAGAIGAFGIAVVCLVLGLYRWWLEPDAFPRRFMASYAAWHQEIATYLMDRTTPRQFALRHAGVALLGLLIGIGCMYLLSPEPLFIPTLFIAGVVLPPFLYKGKVSIRREELLRQIDPALQLIANALQVAPNLDEALNLVAQHLKPPMSEEVARVTAAYRMGQSLDDALQDMARRCSDPFVTAMVIALVVGRRTGGNVAGTLRRIAYSTREAVRVELELSSKTRGQRNQFYLVSLLYPLGLIGMKVMMPEAWQQLIHSYWGKVALFASMSVVALAIVWAQKILNPDNL